MTYILLFLVFGLVTLVGCVLGELWSDWEDKKK